MDSDWTSGPQDDLFFEAPPAQAAPSPSVRRARPSYRVKQCAPQWFCPLVSHTAGGGVGVADGTELKHAADHAYFSADYPRAIALYEAVLAASSVKNTTVRRDVIEALSRACMKLDDNTRAKDWALQLHATSHKDNVEHTSVSLNLLAAVSFAQKDFLSAMTSLAQVMQHHAFVPDFWSRLGRAYAACELGQLTGLPYSCQNRRQVVAFCHVRAVVLLQTVERTVRSFAKATNRKRQEEEKQVVSKLGLSLEEVDRIQLYASMDIFNRARGGAEQEGEEASTTTEKGEFEDLGKSERLKKIEASFENVPKKSEVMPSLEVLSRFEEEWFSFLE